MPELNNQERLALIRFLEEYAPDANLANNDWSKTEIAWLDQAYDDLHEPDGSRPEVPDRA